MAQDIDKDSGRWDLSSLFKSAEEWEVSLAEVKTAFDAFTQYRGHLGDADTLLVALRGYEAANIQAEAVSEYASLLYYADCTDAAAQTMHGKARMAMVEAGEKTSFFEPEVLSIDDGAVMSWMEREDYKPYRVYLMRLLRQKAHTLSAAEERLMSLQGESAATASTAFGALTNADMDFGTVRVGSIDAPLTQGTWGSFMESADRTVRQEAYTKFYRVFEHHKETLAALYAGQVSHDVFTARARGYQSCLSCALYYDNVDESVYRNLIETVHRNLPALHRYYALMKKALGVEELRHYDVYAPLVKEHKTHRVPYTEAVDLCTAALSPLGADYTAALRRGLLGGWVDRYERRGKRSGAFSSGSYRSAPFILLNYQDDTLRDVFTVAHEGGHSMHSLYSAASNPFMQYNYSIFEAEVASTLNEELLFRYLLKEAGNPVAREDCFTGKQEGRIAMTGERTSLLERRAKDIVATLYRQTMFAEFELATHEMVERGEPLSVEVLRTEYRHLLTEYFGSLMHFEDNSDLECLRIPHFYNAFYVYKYATGMSAALAIADRIMGEGGSRLSGSSSAPALRAVAGVYRDDPRGEATSDYMAFLHSGGSRWPIDALKVAGVDMSKSAPVQAACDAFAAIVDELERCV